MGEKELPNWNSYEESAFHLFQQYKNNVISEDHYLSNVEDLFREYLSIEPDHQLCKQHLANILQKRLTVVSAHEHEKLYGELVLLSPHYRFKEGLAQILYIKSKPDFSAYEFTKLIVNSLYPQLKKILPILIEEEGCKNIEALHPLSELEELYRLLVNVVPKENRYRDRLAKILYLKAKEMERAGATIHSNLESVQEYYRESIQLDPEHALYRKEWMELLQKREQALQNDEQNLEVINKRIQICFEKLSYDQTNSKIKTKIEYLLFEKEALIYQKHDEGLLTERQMTSELKDVYHYLHKVNPSDQAYKFSLAKLLISKGRSLKGSRNREAYRLFQEIFQLDKSNNEAMLRMSIIHIYEGEANEALDLLSTLSCSLDSFRGTDLEIEFCLTYAVAYAHVSQIEEAHFWLQKASELDQDGKFRYDWAAAKTQIQMCSKIVYCQLNQIGKGKKMIDAITIDQMIQEFEEERRSQSAQKIIFDFRSIDSPKIIGPKNTRIIAGEGRVKILEYLLNSKEPRMIEQIRAASLLDKASRETIRNIRKELAKVFCVDVSNHEEYMAAQKLISNEVLITFNGPRYQWAFQGETYVITNSE